MIEVGKKYEIVNSWNGNNGKIVTVTGYGGKSLDGCTTITGDRWYVDQWVTTTYGDKINHMGEKQLKPVYDGDEKISWGECVWKPETLRRNVT